MSNTGGDAADWVRDALARARYEVLPTASTLDAVVHDVPRDVRLTVTASPARGMSATLDVTERLVGAGYAVVPHLAARMIRDRVELGEIVARLTALGVVDVFCMGGDAQVPAGVYDGALPMLEDLTAMDAPFQDIGIAGYPEPHPELDDAVTARALADKRHHATYIVSNLCFDVRAIEHWLRDLRTRGIALPVLVGMPGPVERARLLRVATRIGVGESIRFLSGHVGAAARIATPGAYSPERFLRRAAVAVSRPELSVDGLHIFTFNQVAATERWRQKLLSSL